MKKNEVKDIIADAINNLDISTKTKKKIILFPKKLKKKHLKVIDAVISFYCTDVVNVRRLSNVKKKKAIVVQHFKNEFQSLFSGSLGS